MVEQYLNEKEAAQILGVEPRTLADWRWKRTGPAYTKLLTGTIRYLASDVNAYAAAGKIVPGATTPTTTKRPAPKPRATDGVRSKPSRRRTPSKRVGGRS